tara:strand:+ start:191 stop:475 length:285 start_codon:yes stop_codon:yes gene_type:complete
MKMMTLLPAYGRDYRSKKLAIADFNNGLDFQLASFGFLQYCSIQDADALSKQIRLRYDKQRKTVHITQDDITGKFVEIVEMVDLKIFWTKSSRS